MADPPPPAGSESRRGDQLPPYRGGGDPWTAFGYLVSGVAVYGVLGWALGSWLHAPYLVPVGILVGAALGLYLVFNRFGRRQFDPPSAGGGSDRPVATDTPDHRGHADRARRPQDARGEDAE